MTLQSTRQFFALSLVILMISGLSACSTHRGQPTAQQPTPTQTATAPTTTTTTTTTQRKVSMPTQPIPPVERPVSVATAVPSSLQSLPPGHPLNYYPGKLKQEGYTIQREATQADRHIYTITDKANHQYQVSLTQPANATKVRTVRVTQVMTAANLPAPTGRATGLSPADISKRIEALRPGKKPVDYISDLDQLGQVTEYRMINQKQAELKMRADNRTYRVSMSVNPSQDKVVQLKLENPAR